MEIKTYDQLESAVYSINWTVLRTTNSYNESSGACRHFKLFEMSGPEAKR